jgi:hypothetical protein
LKTVERGTAVVEGVGHAGGTSRSVGRLTPSAQGRSSPTLSGGADLAQQELHDDPLGGERILALLRLG